MSTIKFNVEDSKAAEILKVIMNSGIDVTYVEVAGDQYLQPGEVSTPSVNQSRDEDVPTFIPNAEIVGGTIFYIDDTADGVYEFLDVYGNVIENVQVGDRPHYYRVMEKGSRDKYYVYHDKLYDNLKWTRSKGYDYVYESLNTSKALGLGRINTETVMTKDNGAYVAENSNGSPTIWYQLQQMNDARVGGCDDWFVPSVYEIEKLRKAILSGSVTGGKIAGRSYETSVFSHTWLHSSSEAFDETIWTWSHYSQYWFSDSKSDEASVFFTRAF